MTWPPNWLQTYGPTFRSVSGEVGILEFVFLSQVLLNKVYLLVHTEEGNVYMGTLLFEKADSAKAVFDFLNSHISKPLTTIAAMDFPE